MGSQGATEEKEKPGVESISRNTISPGEPREYYVPQGLGAYRSALGAEGQGFEKRGPFRGYK